MARMTSELIVKLTDRVSGPARQVAAALKAAEQQTKAIAAATKAGLGNRFAGDLVKIGASAGTIDKVTRSWDAYRRSAGLAADATKWTKSQTAGVKAWERSNLAALKHVHAARTAAGSAGATAGGMSAGQGALLGAAASRAGLALRAAPVVAVGAALYKATKSALDFEAVMYEVQKATDSTGDGTKRYADAILDMSTKTGKTAAELGGILASAGFAGRPKEDLLAFTSYAAKATGAWGTGAEATGQALAELGNIYQASQSRIEEIGDAINSVADSSASKEVDLLDFLRRSGAQAKILGISAEETLAFGAALKEVGVQSEVAATGFNALLTKLSTGAEDDDWNKQLKALGINTKTFTATLKKDAPAAIKTLLTHINKIEDGTKKMSVLKDLFGAEYADDIARLAGNLGGLEKMLGLVANKAKFLGSVDKAFQLLTEKDYNRVARFNAQMERLSISVGGPLKTGLGAAADQASRLFESFQDGGAAAKVIAEMAVAAKQFDKNATGYVRDQIARQEAEGAAPREYDPEARKAIDNRRDYHVRDVVNRKVSEFDSQIAEKQARLDSLPKYPRLRAKPEADLVRLRGERQGLIDALSAKDRANIELIENSVARDRINTRQKGFGDYYGDKPVPITPGLSSFGFGPNGEAGGPPVGAAPTMRIKDAQGRATTSPIPLPPPRPESLPRAVHPLKSFDDIFATPKVDLSEIDAAKTKAGEASEAVKGLDLTVKPNVETGSLHEALSLAQALTRELQKAGALSVAAASAGRGRSDVATATANLSRSRQTNMTDRSYVG